VVVGTYNPDGQDILARFGNFDRPSDFLERNHRTMQSMCVRRQRSRIRRIDLDLSAEQDERDLAEVADLQLRLGLIKDEILARKAVRPASIAC
jgi:hypothetical protein